MKKLYFRIAIVAFALTTATVCFCLWQGVNPLDLFAEAKTSQEQVVPKGELILRISTEQNTLTVGERPKIQASITNVSSNEITLVQPGDGSEVGWRTPIVKWAVIKAGETTPPSANGEDEQVARCGNMNPLRPEEVFQLKPGETKEFKEWVNPMPFDEPGIYKVSLVYENIPSLGSKGASLDEREQSAKRRIKQSAKCLLVSNQIELTVR